jgi:hypothetical protein
VDRIIFAIFICAIFSRFKQHRRQEVRESFCGQVRCRTPTRCSTVFGGGPFLRFPQKWGFFRAVQLQTGANSYAATSLCLLVVALSCHSERRVRALLGARAIKRRIPHSFRLVRSCLLLVALRRRPTAHSCVLATRRLLPSCFLVGKQCFWSHPLLPVTYFVCAKKEEGVGFVVPSNNSRKGALHPMKHDYSTEQFQAFRQEVREIF